MTRVILVRHGETDWNVQRRAQGAIDIPLNETGRAQARAAAGLLAVGSHVLLAASPLSRARETAEILGAVRGWELQLITPLLQERSFGPAEGLTLDELATRYPEGIHSDFAGAEPLSHVASRGVRALRVLAACAAGVGGSAEREVVAVTHGALLRRVITSITDGARPLPTERIGNGQSYAFDVSRRGIMLLPS